jgi:hypothetical protein
MQQLERQHAFQSLKVVVVDAKMVKSNVAKLNTTQDIVRISAVILSQKRLATMNTRIRDHVHRLEKVGKLGMF